MICVHFGKEISSYFSFADYKCTLCQEMRKKDEIN